MDLGKTIWRDGEWLNYDDANLPMLTHSLHYGLSIFDGIRCYQTQSQPQIFRLKEHMKRFVESAKIVNMPLNHGADELCQAAVQLVQKNHHRSCYIRPLGYYGNDRMGLSTQGMRGHVAIISWQWGAYLGEEGILKGIRTTISSYTRHHPNISMVRAKVGGNYVNSQLAKADAIANGYSEALMLDPEGFVVEGTGENLFIVENGILITPPQGSILPGITRDTVMTLAREQGVEVKEDRITRDRLLIADECFLTGTAAEITPVREVDRRPIGSGEPGPVTKKIQEKFFQVVGGELAGYEHWLTPVPGQTVV